MQRHMTWEISQCTKSLAFQLSTRNHNNIYNLWQGLKEMIYVNCLAQYWLRTDCHWIWLLLLDNILFFLLLSSTALSLLSCPFSYVLMASASRPVVSQSEVYTASVSPRNALEVQILRPHPKPTKAGTVEVESSSLCFNEPFRWGLLLWTIVYVGQLFSTSMLLQICEELVVTILDEPYWQLVGQR